MENLGRSQPWLAWPLTIAMLSLAGFPATVGFVGKFYLIDASVAGDYAWLGVTIVIGSVISLVYYLRVVALMWLGTYDVSLPDLPHRRVKPVAGWSPEADARAQPEVAAVAIVFAAATLFFGIWPTPLFDLARDVGTAISSLGVARGPSRGRRTRVWAELLTHSERKSAHALREAATCASWWAACPCACAVSSRLKRPVGAGARRVTGRLGLDLASVSAGVDPLAFLAGFLPFLPFLPAFAVLVVFGFLAALALGRLRLRLRPCSGLTGVSALRRRAAPFGAAARAPAPASPAARPRARPAAPRRARPRRSRRGQLPAGPRLQHRAPCGLPIPRNTYASRWWL